MKNAILTNISSEGIINTRDKIICFIFFNNLENRFTKLFTREKDTNQPKKKEEYIMKKLSKLTIFLIPIGIAVNVVGGQLAILLKLPLFLDSIGTIVVGAVCGGLPGALVGLGCGLINAISLPTLLPYTIIGIIFGFVASFFAKKKMFTAFWKAPINGVIFAIIATCLAVPITATLYGGFVGTGASVIVTTLMAAGWGVLPATFVSELSSELMDKLTCLIIIFFILKAMPARLLVKLPNGKYFVKED